MVQRVEQKLNMNIKFEKFHRCGIICRELVKFLEGLKKIEYYINIFEKAGYFVVKVPPIVEL